ncbi:YggS family pyridoxal phosphate-dependent enzyme [Bacterioplanoides sp. SCSIO 12839]|uniref:YggS family pyridoxal phosphate-dependent enzyme n=1 Tax=Bacterioplanoides sp. SCSIO 12839 TaxID=2829569 RepID=UPI0021062642|nr:YggS family pyridoxal phosphate-dependent enzyme [Bacterioplanoides sp. SCSIO 12839]UTW48577.1 YggS family pyridoxal phosphate-dependent enzyme [Bacterioplanoides sp. SCSIO 12839]
MSTLEQHYQQVSQRLQQACDQSKRAPQTVKLLAVSKTKPATMVETIYQQGQRSFGENYLQDAQEKIDALQHLTDIEWHFIGPIQSNKTRPIATHFHWAETVCRDKIAQRLNDQRPADMPPLNVLLQINISGEDQKAGIHPDEVDQLAALVAQLPNLSLRGVMCIPENTQDDAALAQQFQAMQRLFQRLQQSYSSVDTLSMGMSADMALAIAYGSTEVRIGTDIFGARS